MKKTLTLAIALISLSAFAGTTATLNLKGVIAPLLDVSVVAETLATNLPLDQAVNSQKVGKVVEKSNSSSGYKVSVSSQNGGKLVRAGDNTSFVSYQLKYNNGNVTLNTSPSVISTNSQRGRFERDLHITYSQPAEYATAGEYTDVVTFTIAAN